MLILARIGGGIYIVLCGGEYNPTFVCRRNSTAWRVISESSVV